MLLVKADKITFKYDSQVKELLSDISFTAESTSRIGVIGNNGSGKSTLLKILLRELRPSSGHLQLKCGLKIGSLVQVQSAKFTAGDFIWSVNPALYGVRQRIKRAEQESNFHDWSAFNDFEEAGGYHFEAAIAKYLFVLQLEPALLELPLETLSGGEKTKIGLLRTLVTEPDLLLLDEPTNHMDVQAIQWLKSFLLLTHCPFILVSHDRRILDECVSEIWELKNGRLSVFSGNYSSTKETKEQQYRADLKRFETQQLKVRRLELAARERRVSADQMEHFKESRSVKKNGGLCKRDAGSGSYHADPTKRMKAAKAVEKRIQLMIEGEQAKKPWLEKQRRIQLPVTSACASKTVLSVRRLELTHGQTPVFSGVNFTVGKNQRIVIVGPNGCGKTSLIKIINKKLAPTAGEIDWAPSARINAFYQENEDLHQMETVLQAACPPDKVEESVARTVLGSLGLDATLIQRQIGQLSPGERVKTALAKTVLSGANVLIFDEPTNHLEIEAREMLEQAIGGYQGAIICASHDLAFIEKLGAQIYDLTSHQMFDSVESWQHAQDF